MGGPDCDVSTLITVIAREIIVNASSDLLTTVLKPSGIKISYVNTVASFAKIKLSTKSLDELGLNFGIGIICFVNLGQKTDFAIMEYTIEQLYGK
jgi:hypothetical protein